MLSLGMCVLKLRGGNIQRERHRPHHLSDRNVSSSSPRSSTHELSADEECGLGSEDGVEVVLPQHNQLLLLLRLTSDRGGRLDQPQRAGPARPQAPANPVAVRYAPCTKDTDRGSTIFDS